MFHASALAMHLQAPIKTVRSCMHSIAGSMTLKKKLMRMQEQTHLEVDVILCALRAAA